MAMNRRSRGSARRVQIAEQLGYCPTTTWNRLVRIPNLIVAAAIQLVSGGPTFSPSDLIFITPALSAVLGGETLYVKVAVLNDNGQSSTYVCALTHDSAELSVDGQPKRTGSIVIEHDTQVRIEACPLTEWGHAEFCVQTVAGEWITIRARRRVMEVLAKVLDWHVATD